MWILIIMVYTNTFLYKPVATVTSVEFTTEDNCTRVKSALNSYQPSGYTVTAICAPK